MGRNVPARWAAAVAFAIALLMVRSAEAPEERVAIPTIEAQAVLAVATRATPSGRSPPLPPWVDRAAALARPSSAGTAAARAPDMRRVDLARSAGLLVPVSRSLEIAGVTHTALDVTKLGLPVFNRRVKRHAGVVAGASGTLTLPRLDSPWKGLSRNAAVEHAARAMGLRVLRAAPLAERGWLALEQHTAAVWRITLPARDPFGTWQVIVEASSGEVLAALDRLRYAEGSGQVFVPNVEQSGGSPSSVPLFDLDDSGFLAGRIARVIDERTVEAFRPDLQFAFPAADPRFVQTSVYRALTDTARLAESHGFPAFPEPLHAFVNQPGSGAGDEYNNAYYDPFLAFFGFGNGDGVVLENVGTDSDVAAHEMGHHLFETLVQPIAVFSSDPALAMHEGVADAIAALWNGDPEIGESVLPGQPYLRTLANARSFPGDVAPDPHETGLIYGGLLWSLAQSIGMEEVGQILMAGLPFLPSQPDPHDFPQALTSGDQAVTGGAHSTTIAALALARGLEDPFPPEYQGQLSEATPESRSLANGAYHFWIFYEFPGSPSVTFQTTGTGDVDLYVAPLVLADDLASYRTSEGVTSDESVLFNASTAPSVNADDAYLVVVQDFDLDAASSSYTLAISSTLPPARTGIPGTINDSLATADELDLFIVNGTAGRVLRVAIQSTTPGLDLVAAVFDPRTPDLLGANDDSGPGLDPLIQGARFPATRPYALAVFSTLGDVDPGAGTGSYTVNLSYCTNTGTNTDGDLLVDACDDDDDDDTFIDDLDTAPTDPALCTDIDADGCDDCSNGAFDPFDDGPDFDSDAVCDAGDVDLDNDGCANPEDPAPLAPSVDADFDFYGADCDNCPSFSNPDQADTDLDGRGDACECGDQDGDGSNTVSDLVAINLAIFTPALATPLCDANGDQLCDVADIVAVNVEIFSPTSTAICARQPLPGP